MRHAATKAPIAAMTDPSKLSTDGFLARTALFYAAFSLLIGVYMPLFPVWLEAKGLDAAQVGLVLAAPAFARIFAVPVATRAADRHWGLREVLIACSVATALGYVALGLTQGAAAILVVAMLASVPHTPMTALLDAYALRGLKQRGRAYGPVRLWGSVSFIAANLGAGLMLDLIAAADLIWLIAVSAGLLMVASVRMTPLAPVALSDRPIAAPRALWRDPVFMAVLVAASLIQASHALYYGFSTIDWKAAGFDGITIGVLWALGVAAEIVLFALSGRFPLWLSPRALLLIGAAASLIRWTAMALDPPAFVLPLLQILHALSFGATHLGTIGFIARSAPETLSATAQGYFSILSGITMGIAMGLAGALYQSHGGASYGAMTLIAVAGGLIVVAVRGRWKD